MPGWKLWMGAASVLGALASFLFLRQTTDEWRDEAPAGSSLAQVQGSMTRSLFRIHGLGLKLRFDDGFRLSWIGPPDHVPVGLVESPRGVHLVLVDWARPLADAGQPRDTVVCWVRDGRPGTDTVVVPLFVPDALVSPIRPRLSRFTSVDPDLVRDAPRMPADEVLRRHDATPQRGACPNLFLAQQL